MALSVAFVLLTSTLTSKKKSLKNNGKKWLPSFYNLVKWNYALEVKVNYLAKVISK
ncbi:MAG: hypothetical protein K9I82_02985 [Chitinophagaceae bacterium]|nr:hypothetical protein [Chitinophagaceae bacterium]